MSMTEKLKNTLQDQVDSWEKQLDEKKANLKKAYAEEKATNSREALYKDSKDKLEETIEQLKRKISAAKSHIKEMTEA